jgi:putative hydrolase of HD superfamily
MDEKETTNLLKYLYEAGQLRMVKRAGWWVAKVKDPESVAEHSFRTAVIAYILAKLEDYPEPEKVAVKAMFHDLHEVRLQDRHKISSNYLKTPKGVERRVEAEQCARLPKPLGKELLETLEGMDAAGEAIARDADMLDVSLAAREYFDLGHKDAWDWIERAGRKLETKSAKRLHAKIKKLDSGSWWRGLKEKGH